MAGAYCFSEASVSVIQIDMPVSSPLLFSPSPMKDHHSPTPASFIFFLHLRHGGHCLTQTSDLRGKVATFEDNGKQEPPLHQSQQELLQALSDGASWGTQKAREQDAGFEPGECRERSQATTRMQTFPLRCEIWRKLPTGRILRVTKKMPHKANRFQYRLT